MKRYFDLIGKNTVEEFDFANSSPYRLTPVKDFERVYKTEMREINREEYKKLKAQYES